MPYRIKQHSLSETVTAFLILAIGGIVIFAFVTSLQTQQQKKISSKELTSLDFTETEKLSEMLDLSTADIQVIQPASTFSPFEASKAPEKKLAPNFTLYSLTDDMVELSNFRGQPIILNFWASWCGPCRFEMPELVRIYETYQDKDLVILAINMTFQDELRAVHDFVDEFDLPFSVLLDEEGTVTNEYYSVLGVPMTFFIKADGTITSQYIGAMTGQQLNVFVKALVEGSVGRNSEHDKQNPESKR
jgi:thiol-disulfide isomerase/thioredoxin